MMLIGWASRRENLLWVTGVEPMKLIRTHLANHIRASSREQWLHQQARHMTAPDRNRSTPTQHLTQGRRPHMTLTGNRRGRMFGMEGGSAHRPFASRSALARARGSKGLD